MKLLGSLSYHAVCGLRLPVVALGVLVLGMFNGHTHGQVDTFDGTGIDDLFNTPGNWVGGVYPGDNFGGNTIDVAVLLNTDIEVDDAITGIGGLTNTTNFDNTFSLGTGLAASFAFNSGATIDPGTGSFTFKIDVTGSSMTFNLASGGDLTFEADGTSFTGTTTITNGAGSSITADTHGVEFNGMVNTNAGGHFIAANGGSFTFNAGMTMTEDGLQTFEFVNEGTFSFLGGASSFNAVNFINSPDGSFTVDTGSVTFDGAVTSDEGGEFIAQNDGDYLFSGSFTATGSQAFNIISGGTFNFTGATSFNGGTITMTGDHGSGQPSNFYFNEVTNGVDGGATAATLRAVEGAEWVFRDEYNFFGAQNFTGDGNGTFRFKDYDNAAVIELDAANLFTANDAALIFERSVNVLEGTTVTAVSGGSYEFQKAMESAINATYSAQGDSSFTFAGFTGTGTQNFTGDNAEEFQFGDVTFSLAGSGLETATFNDATATMASLALDDGYNVSLGGFNGATLETGKLTASGSHTFAFATSSNTRDSVFSVTGVTTFADDATLTFNNTNGGNGEFSAIGDVVIGTGTTTFHLDPTAVSSENLTVTLGSEFGSVETSGNIDFTSSSASEDANATAELAGVVELEGEFEDFTINSTMGAGGVLELSNGALGSVEAQLNVVSGKLLANGIDSVGDELSVDLAADTTFELKPAHGGDIGFEIGELTGGGSLAETDQAIIQSATGAVIGVDAMLQVLSGDYSGIIQDAQEPGDDSTMSLSVQEGEFTFSGNGTYSGTTGVIDGGTFILTGTIDNTSQVQVRDTSTLTIDSGTLITEEHGGDPGNMSLLAKDSTVNLNGTAALTTEGSLTVGGQFNASDSSKSIIKGVGVVQEDGVLTVQNSATMDFEDAGASLTINSGGTVDVTDSAIVTTTGTLELESGGTLTMEGPSTLELNDDLNVSGTGSITGPAVVNAMAADVNVKSGGTLTLIGDTATGYASVTADNLNVESGGSLIGDANFDFGAGGSLNYAGSVHVGALEEATGRMEITQGDLVAEAGGTVTFGLSYDSITQLGANSFISVNAGVADFRDSDTLWLEVQKNPNNPLVNCYIPTDQKFTLLKAQSFQLPTGTSELSPVAYQNGQEVQSVTRRWITQTEQGHDGLKHLTAESEANYLGWKPGTTDEYCLTGEMAQIGDWLNKLIPTANADPDGQIGQYLGYLDTITDCPDYELVTRQHLPNPIVSAIHMAPQSQFFDVLRNEIQREAQSSGVGSPAPLRLSSDPGTLVMQSDEQEIASTVRRTSRPQFNYAVIGRAFYRHLSTPNVGSVIGFDGDEYGGFGGFAFDLSKGMIIGFDIGYSEFSGNLNDNYGTGKTGTLRAGPYFSYADPSGWFIDLALSGGWNHYSYTRLTSSTGGTATDGTGDGFEIDAMVGGGFRFDLKDGFAITPQASFLYSYINTGTVTETPNTTPSFPTVVDPGDLNSFIGRAGVNLAFKALPGLIFDVEGGWQGNYTLASEYSQSVVGGTVVLPVSVDATNLNTAYYGAGVSWLASWSVGLNLRYAGRSGGGLQSNMIYGGVSFRF